MKLGELVLDPNFDPTKCFLSTELEVYSDSCFSRVIVWVKNFLFSSFDKVEVAKKLDEVFGRPLAFQAKTVTSTEEALVQGHLEKIRGRLNVLQERNSIPKHAAAHPERNRYSDILPEESTRFMIMDDPSFYFNANWVLGGKAIACQGPLETEKEEFWKMTFTSGASGIVMLTNLIERGRVKCSTYWPEAGEEQFGQFKVANTGERSLFREGEVELIARNFLVTKGESERAITQYHLKNWPDHGVVSPSVLSRLLKILNTHTDRDDCPLIAHCSAGVGRTGTVLSSLEALRRHKGGVAVDIKKIIEELRSERSPQMVQTYAQEQLAFQTVDAMTRGFFSRLLFPLPNSLG